MNNLDRRKQGAVSQFCGKIYTNQPQQRTLKRFFVNWVQ
jgi:hypothetical protein